MLLISLFYSPNVFLFFYQFIVLFDVNIQDAVNRMHILYILLTFIIFLKFRSTHFFIMLLPYLLNLIFFVLAHSLVLFVLLLVNLIKDASTTFDIVLVTLQEQPFTYIWKAEIYDAFEKVIYKVLSFVTKLSCFYPELAYNVVYFRLHMLPIFFKTFF